MIITLPLTVLSACLTYSLSRSKYISSVMSSSIVGGLGFVILSSLGFPEFAPYIFGASFVGMSQNSVMSLIEVIIAALLFLLVFIFLSQYFQGYGGLLGLSAFVGVLMTKLTHLLKFGH